MPDNNAIKLPVELPGRIENTPPVPGSWKDNFIPGYFTANKVTGSITGGDASNSPALAIKACAIGPSRCAFRPSSSGNVSNTPNVDALSCNAYHRIVFGSACASATALSINSLTSFSFPGLASSLANRANFSMVCNYKCQNS